MATDDSAREKSEELNDTASFIDYVSQDNLWWTVNPGLTNLNELPIGLTQIVPSESSLFEKGFYYYPDVSIVTIYFYQINPFVDIDELQTEYGPLYRILRSPKNNIVPKY